MSNQHWLHNRAISHLAAAKETSPRLSQHMDKVCVPPLLLVQQISPQPFVNQQKKLKIWTQLFAFTISVFVVLYKNFTGGGLSWLSHPREHQPTTSESARSLPTKRVKIAHEAASFKTRSGKDGTGRYGLFYALRTEYEIHRGKTLSIPRRLIYLTISASVRALV